MTSNCLRCLAVAALLLGGCSHPARTPATPPSPIPTRDLGAGTPGAGTPGAYCATNRLGKRFAKDGVTYECKGPKPYRWRAVVTAAPVIPPTRRTS